MKYRKINRRDYSVAIGVLFILLSLVSCSGNNSSHTSGLSDNNSDALQSEESKKYVFREEELSLTLPGMENADRFFSDRSWCYLTFSVYHEASERFKTTLYRLKHDGSSLSEINLGDASETNAEYQAITADPFNGGVFMIKTLTVSDANPPKKSAYLVHLTANGKKTLEAPIDLPVIEEAPAGVSSIHPTPAGVLILTDNQELRFYNREDGSLIKTIIQGYSSYEENNEWFTVYVAPDGTSYKVTHDQNKTGETARLCARVIDPGTGNVSSDVKPLPSGSYGYQATGSHGYSFYEAEGGDLYAYNIGDTERTKIMDAMSSDIPAEYFTGLAVESPESFTGLYRDNDGNVKLSVFRKVKPEDIRSKQILTLGCVQTSPAIRKMVVQYNKSNPDYRIRVVDYSTRNKTSDWDSIVQAFNTDIVSGNIPDIIFLDSADNLPVYSYTSKGLFADLNEFLDADDQIKKSDLLPNVLDALSSGDRLFRIGPSVNIMTVTARERDTKGLAGNWTLDDCRRIIESQNVDYARAFGWFTRESILYRALLLCGNSFIDWENKNCTFDSQTFADLLEFAKLFPQEVDSNMLGDGTDDNPRNGKTCFHNTFLYSFDDYRDLRYGSFGEEVSFVGFPLDGKQNYAALTMDTQLAISSSCAHKNAAWDFVRSFLSEDYQDQISTAFPVRKSSLEKLALKAKETPFEMNADGQRIEQKRIFYLNDTEIVLPNLTDKDVADVMRVIQGTTLFQYNNPKVLDIILEESALFFHGRKSAREVCNIIQSRVKTYVEENS